MHIPINVKFLENEVFREVRMKEFPPFSLFSYFYTFLFFIFSIFVILIFLWFVWVIMNYCTCDWISVCGCMLMYEWYFYVLVYCPTYCRGCLTIGMGCLLNVQHLISWARVYTVDVFQGYIQNLKELPQNFLEAFLNID